MVKMARKGIILYLDYFLMVLDKRRRRTQMVASTIAILFSPNSMIELGGHHVSLF